MKNKLYLQKIICLFLMICGMKGFSQFSGAFAPANWNFSTTTFGGDGSVNTSGAPSSIILNGSDNGGGGSNQYEQYSITIPSNGKISFAYSHINPDLDDAQYVINGVATNITYAGSGSLANISVNAGDVFSFRVTNYDNCCGRGVLTISNFGFISGESLNFDGVNDKVVLSNSINSVLDPLNTITVEAWVNPTNTVFNGVIAGNYGSPSNNMQFLLRRDGNSYTFWVDAGTGYQVVGSGASSVMLNTWQHVAGVWDGSALYTYINGVLMGTTTGVTGSSFASTSNNIVIGSNSV
ncbi:MAG: LamG domain-containing protein, partial [Burkholderiales bacterium]|nr:LamG domain-containing protein [Bacteroidia bacterium]